MTRVTRPPAATLLGAAALLVGLVLLAAALVGVGRDAPGTPPPAPRAVEGPVVTFGGDVNLGRRQNAISAAQGPAAALGRISALRRADLGVVNLESVVASSGWPAEKGEDGPYYFRGRPETLAVLAAAGVDVVATANNHSGDYGPGALLEQADLLDRMRMGHAGAGADLDQACAPVIRPAGDLRVAVFSVDATMAHFAARVGRPGTCYLPPEDPARWTAAMGPRIRSAREVADVVLVAVHAGDNYAEVPGDDEVGLSRGLVDAGADAVLGSSAHVLQGIEVYRQRPIIYDAGNLLFDFHDEATAASATFSLVLALEGVRQVRVDPVVSEYGASRPARGHEAPAILDRLRSDSAALGTTLLVQGGTGYLDLPALPDRSAPRGATATRTAVALRPAPKPLRVPPAGCMSPDVPRAAQVTPRSLGPLTLVGAAVEPQRLAGRATVWVDTWWRAESRPKRDLWIGLTGAPAPEGAMVPWRGDHEPCDWMWPTTRWRPGVTYHDRYGLRPPDAVSSAQLELQVGLLRGDRQLGNTSLTQRVEVSAE